MTNIISNMHLIWHNNINLDRNKLHKQNTNSYIQYCMTYIYDTTVLYIGIIHKCYFLIISIYINILEKKGIFLFIPLSGSSLVTRLIRDG